MLSDLRGLVNQDEFDLHAELPALVAECAPPSPALAALTNNIYCIITEKHF